jgi:hypothetical protein
MSSLASTIFVGSPSTAVPVGRQGGGEQNDQFAHGSHAIEGTRGIRWSQTRVA